MSDKPKKLLKDLAANAERSGVAVLNRACRRKHGIREEKIRVNLEEWRANPDKIVSRGEVMAFMQLHLVNHHKPGFFRRLKARLGL